MVYGGENINMNNSGSRQSKAQQLLKKCKKKSTGMPVLSKKARQKMERRVNIDNKMMHGE